MKRYLFYRNQNACPVGEIYPIAYFRSVVLKVGGITPWGDF